MSSKGKHAEDAGSGHLVQPPREGGGGEERKTPGQEQRNSKIQIEAGSQVSREDKAATVPKVENFTSDNWVGCQRQKAWLGGWS